MLQKMKAARVALSIVLMLGIAGCTRTIDDIQKWKLAGREDKLIKALEDPKGEIRSAAADALGELKSTAAVDPLAKLFSDTDSAARKSSAKALVSIGGAQASEHLIGVLKLKDFDMRLIAATGLGSLKAANAAPALATTLDDEKDTIRCAAAESLGKIGLEESSNPLVNKLVSGSDELRLAIVQALAFTKGQAAINGLVSALADKNKEVFSAAMASLVTIGAPDIEPALHTALKSDKQQVRRGAVNTLREANAIPLTGDASIWYELAKASLAKKSEVDLKTIERMTRSGMKAADPLLEAVAHSNETIREYASRALEELGEPCTAKVVSAAQARATGDAATWFKARNEWEGYPNWKLDLWGAAAALNPDFLLEPKYINSMKAKARPAFLAMSQPEFRLAHVNIPYLVQLLGDDTTPPPPGPTVDEDGIPIVQKKIDQFRGATNQIRARERLIETGGKAIFPLIAALNSRSALVQDNAAGALGAIADRRAIEPLMKVVEQKLSAGENLADSQLYSALLSFHAPEAEPLVLRIRPNTDRVIQVIERTYPSVSVKVCETRESSGGIINNSVKFFLGYSENGNDVEETSVIFSKNTDGNWTPNPPLPEHISMLKK